MEINKQLKKGVLEILVLKLLSIKDMYGYELITCLDKNTDGMFKMKEGTLYPILYRLEDENIIENYWENSEKKRGVPRKYYRITSKGKEDLQFRINQWNELNSKVENIISLEEL